MNDILNENFNLPLTTPSDPDPVSDEDKYIIEYIAGFALHRARKIAQNQADGQLKHQELDIIKSITQESEECTSQLICTKQRGGLLSVEPCIIPVFTKLEYIIRKYTGKNVTMISIDGIVGEVCND